MSHLINDADRGGPIVELDVREQMRTREVNAREDRNLARVHQSYERAKDIYEKNNSWERWKVGQSLQGIWERTPRLERSLATEKARVESLHQALLSHSRSGAASISKQNAKELVTKTSIPEHAKTQVKRGGRGRGRRARRGARAAAHGQPDKNEEQDSKAVSIRERNLQRQADFVRRSEHVVKALAKLSWRQESRRREHEQYVEELATFSKPVLERARVVLKGRNDVDLEQSLAQLVTYFASDHKGLHVSGSEIRRKDGEDTKRHQPPKNPGGSMSDRMYSQNTLTEKNLKHLDLDEEPKGFLPSVSESVCTDFSICDKQAVYKRDYFIDEVIPNWDNKSEIRSAGSDTHEAYFPPQSEPQVVSKHDAKDFHLPPLVGASTSRYSQKGGDREVRDSFDQGLNMSKNTDMYSSSTSVSQVILEEDEFSESGAAQLDNTYASASTLGHSWFSHTPVNLSHSVIAEEDEEKGDTFLLSCAVGLPRIWQQPAIKQKEKPAEISLATFAREHKRKRRGMQRL